jgi:hypothetical protein
LIMHDVIYQRFLTITSKNPPGDEEIKLLVGDQTMFLRRVFRNWAPNYASLRLTPLGHTIMSKMYQTWGVDIKNQRSLFEQSHTLLHLHNKMRTPYFVGQSWLYVYSSEVALEFEMMSRDVAAWLKME